MRLGLLGPAMGREDTLERAMRFLQREIDVHRAVYLDIDDALERVVRRWAESLVGGEPDESAIFARAAEKCAAATPEQIDRFIQAELERRSLQVFESLAGEDTRAIELMNGRVVVMIYDKATLDEEDIVSASVLAFGKGREPLVKQVGSRWFLSPGTLEHFGVMTLEDLEDGIHLVQFDSLCREVRRERLIAARTPRLRVSGGEG
jgi:hypothetical protein